MICFSESPHIDEDVVWLSTHENTHELLQRVIIILEMTALKLNLCYRCAVSLRTDSNSAFFHHPRITPRRASTRSFFTKRSLSLKKPVLQISPPDPSSPPSSSTSPPIQRDPGLTLGNNGIPVPPSSSTRKKDYIDEKSWAETVFRTLSGGMKSDYIKCTYFQTNVV